MTVTIREVMTSLASQIVSVLLVSNTQNRTDNVPATEHVVEMYISFYVQVQITSGS